MIRNIILLSVLVCPAFTPPEGNTNIISWSAQRKLQWKDFKGKTGDRQGESAVTDYSISYTIHAFDNVLHIVLKNCFSSQTSWAADTTRKILLFHEQGHFDMAEIYARQMRQALKKVNFKYDSVSAQFIKIYTHYYDRLNKEQDAYDLLTEYSHNILEQKKWSIRIDSTLKTLDAYKDTIVEVKIVK